MYIPKGVLSLLIASSIGPALGSGFYKPDPYEQLHQTAYGLALVLDNKDYDALENYMTRDVVYDNSALGPSIGGVCRGLENCKAAIKASFGNALVAHDVKNSLIDFPNPKTAHVITYLTWSKWDLKALQNTNKTFRIFEKCDDVFVLGNDDKWRMKTSVVTNLGPKPEAPYFGKLDDF